MMDDNLYELPDGWAWTKLKEITDSQKGKKPKKLGPKSNILSIPYIVIKSFEKGIFEKYTDGNGCVLCKKKDILIVWDGARCGLAGIGVSGAVGSTIAKLICYELNRLFMFYFIKSKYEYINNRPKGVGIPHVDPNIFWNIFFPLPPLPEQQRIVTKIEELFTNLDTGIKALETVKTQLKRYRQAVLKRAFEGELTREWRELHKEELELASVLLEQIKEERKKNLNGKKRRYKESPSLKMSNSSKLGEKWILTKICKIAEIIMGQSPPSESYNREGRGVPLINGPVEFGPYPFSKTIKSKFTTAPKKMCKKNDLLLCVRGSTTGRMNIAGFDACIGRGVATIRSFLYQPYLNFFIHSIEKQIFRLGTGSTFPNVTLGNLNNISIPFPPLPEQYKIVEEIEQRFSIINEIEKTVDTNLKKAERLRQSILKKAFEGKLVPQNPHDEPAHVLLERIKAEKNKKNLKKSKKKEKNTKRG